MTGTHPGRASLAVFILTAVLLLAACTSSSTSAGGPGVASVSSARGSVPPSSSAPGSTVRSAIAYSACMRDHGVPNYPDPDSTGNLTKQDAQHLGVSEVRLEAARTACQHVLPTSPSLTPAALRQCVLAGVCPHALVAMALTEMRNFARCMRGHGVSHWPDPSLGPNSVPSFDLSGAGYSRAQANSALIRQMQATCSHEMPDVGGAPVR